MIRDFAIRIGLALALPMAATATGLDAQVKTASADSSNTYVTPDGYGLGTIVKGSITDVTVRTRAAMIRMKIVEEPAWSLGHGWRELLDAVGKT